MKIYEIIKNHTQKPHKNKSIKIRIMVVKFLQKTEINKKTKSENRYLLLPLPIAKSRKWRALKKKNKWLNLWYAFIADARKATKNYATTAKNSLTMHCFAWVAANMATRNPLANNASFTVISRLWNHASKRWWDGRDRECCFIIPLRQ